MATAARGLSTTWGAEQWSETLIESLILQSALLRAGATRIVTDSRVVHAPRLVVHPSAPWVAELSELPSDAGQADTLVLVPRKLGNVISLSSESISDASIDELTAVGNAMVKGVAVQVDQAPFSNNAATSTVPAGLLSYALPGTGAGDAVNIDGILDAISAIESHGGVPDTVWAAPSDIGAIRKLKSTQGVYLLAPDGASVEGAPLLSVTAQHPTARIVTGSR